MSFSLVCLLKKIDTKQVNVGTKFLPCRMADLLIKNKMEEIVKK